MNQLRLARQARGYSQQQLAGMAGVSRQAVSSVESGLTDPSLKVALALARALGMNVEELFGPGVEVAPVAARPIGSVAEGQRVGLVPMGSGFVALPLSGAAAARSGFAAAGGLALGRDAVRPIGPPRPTVVVAGCDPALPLLEVPLGLLDLAFHWWPCSSQEALRLAAVGLVHAAGVHGPAAAAHRPADESAAVPDAAQTAGFSCWREGLVLRPGLGGDADLRSVRLVNREPGAEARRVLDRYLAERGLAADQVSGYETQATGHLEVAAAIAAGLADVGVASEPSALAYGLGFVPLATERFDLVIPDPGAREAQALLRVLASPWLAQQLASLPGYAPRH